MAKDAKSDRNLGQEAIRSVLTYEQLVANAESLWAMATQGTRPDYAECAKCGHRARYERPDLMGRVNAQEKLLVGGWGKPKDEGEGRQGFVLNRVVVAPNGEMV